MKLPCIYKNICIQFCAKMQEEIKTKDSYVCSLWYLPRFSPSLALQFRIKENAQQQQQFKWNRLDRCGLAKDTIKNNNETTTRFLPWRASHQINNLLSSQTKRKIRCCRSSNFKSREAPVATTQHRYELIGSVTKRTLDVIHFGYFGLM